MFVSHHGLRDHRMSQEALNGREVTRRFEWQVKCTFECHAICLCLQAVDNAGGDTI